MCLNNDLYKLPLREKRIIARLAKRLMAKFPATHTIIAETKRGVKNGVDHTDFELTLFIDDTIKTEVDSLLKEESGISVAIQRSFQPGMAYEARDYCPFQDETHALKNKYYKVYGKTRENYLNFLCDHLCYFTKHNFIDIVTVNTTEMEKDNPLFYQLYIAYRFEKGYLVYHKTLRPEIILGQEDEDADFFSDQ